MGRSRSAATTGSRTSRTRSAMLVNQVDPDVARRQPQFRPRLQPAADPPPTASASRSTTRTSASPSPATPTTRSLMTGWGKRTYNWEFSTGVQHELLPRVSVGGQLFPPVVRQLRRHRQSRPVGVGLRSVTASRRRGIRTCRMAAATRSTGLYSVKPTKFGVPADNFVTLSDNYGKRTEHWNGVDILLNARPRQRLHRPGRRQHRPHRHRQLRGGREATRDASSASPSSSPRPRCSSATGTRVRDAGQRVRRLHDPEGRRAGVGNLSNRARSAAVGELLRLLAESGGPLPGIPFQTVNILEPGSKYGDRLHQVDCGSPRSFASAGRARTSISTSTTCSTTIRC